MSDRRRLVEDVRDACLVHDGAGDGHSHAEMAGAMSGRDRVLVIDFGWDCEQRWDLRVGCHLADQGDHRGRGPASAWAASDRDAPA